MGNEDGQETPEVVTGTEILLAPIRAKKEVLRPGFAWAVGGPSVLEPGACAC